MSRPLPAPRGRPLPDLADRLPPPPPENPRTERLRTIQAVRSFLSVLGPAVLVVEDLHWVDEATRELLLMLARDLPGQVSLVLTHRAEGVTARTPVLGSAYRPPPGTSGAVIPLSPLTENDLLELAADPLGTHATPALATALYERSEGLPLVAEEDLLTLTEQSRAHDHHGIAAELRDADVPRGLREAMTERLASLSPAGAAVAEAAAVLAVPAPQHLLAEIAGLDREQSVRGLVEALDISVLREAEDGRYSFRHALGQQVAYRYVPGPRRAILHERAIEVLGGQKPPPLVQIAHHTLAVGDRPAWLRRAEEAANQAIAVGDTGTAAALLHQILDEPDLDADQRSRAALALAGIANRGVDPVAHGKRLRRILADPQLSKAVRGEIRLGLGLLMFNELADGAGAGEIEKAVEELGENPERAARAMGVLALNERQPPDAAWAWLKRAEHAVEDSPNEAVKAMIHANRLTLLVYSGDPSVWPLMDTLPRRADDPELRLQTARALLNVADGATEIGHDRRAAGLLEEGRNLLRELDYPLAECYTDLAVLRLDGLAGRWGGLEERFADLVTVYPAMNAPQIEQALFLGQLMAARGQRARALECFGTAAEEGERYVVTVPLRAAAGLTAVHLAQDAPGRAWAVAGEAMPLLRRSGSWAKSTGLVPAAVEAALASGEREAAEEIVEDAARGIEGRDAPAAAAELDLARGLLLKDTDSVRAAEHFADAEAAWREIGRPYETARAAEHRASALAESDPARAARPLEETAATYTALGATADLARVQHLSRRLGLTRPKTVGRRGYGDRLSPREQQVAELLARAATNQEIADTLFLSPRTVEHHVANVLRKLGTVRKNVAARLAQQDEAP